MLPTLSLEKAAKETKKHRQKVPVL